MATVSVPSCASVECSMTMLSGRRFGEPEIDRLARAQHVERAVGRQQRLLLERERQRRRDRQGRGGEQGAEEAGAPHQALRLIMPTRLIWWR